MASFVSGGGGGSKYEDIIQSSVETHGLGHILSDLQPIIEPNYPVSASSSSGADISSAITQTLTDGSAYFVEHNGRAEICFASANYGADIGIILHNFYGEECGAIIYDNNSSNTYVYYDEDPVILSIYYISPNAISQLDPAYLKNSIYVATYNNSSYFDVVSAYQSGKTVIVKDSVQLSYKRRNDYYILNSVIESMDNHLIPRFQFVYFYTYGDTIYLSFIYLDEYGDWSQDSAQIVTYNDFKNARTWYGTCSTNTNETAKVVSCNDFILHNGVTIDVKFTYGHATTSATLNVNNTGAKTITGATSGAWNGGDVVKFTYDGTNWNIVGNNKNWNNVELRKDTNYVSDGVYVPMLVSTNSTTAFLTYATSTPSQYRIAKYDAGSSLYSTTPASGDDSTKVATTAFVQDALDSPNIQVLNNAVENEGIGYVELGDTIVDHVTIQPSDWEENQAVLAQATSSVTLVSGQEYKITINDSVYFVQALTTYGTIIVNAYDDPHYIIKLDNGNIIINKYEGATSVTSSITITIEECTIHKINKELIDGDVFVAYFGTTTYAELYKAIEKNKIIFVDQGGGNSDVGNGYICPIIRIHFSYYEDYDEDDNSVIVKYIELDGTDWSCSCDSSNTWYYSGYGHLLSVNDFLQKGIPVLYCDSRATDSTKILQVRGAIANRDFSIGNGGTFAVSFHYGNTVANPLLQQEYNSNTYPIACAISPTEFSTELECNTWGAGEIVLFQYDGTRMVHSPTGAMVMVKGTDYVTAGQKSGTTLGTKATAEGDNTTASGINSHAEGSGTKATSAYAHAEGVGTTASNSGAHAEGMNTTASGMYAHAEGWTNTASSQGAHAEGMNTYATNQAAHAEGCSNTASGYYSHAEGYGTTARRRSQHVFGELNVLDTGGSGTTVKGTYVEIVGNGTADNARSNARTLDWSGNETLAGKLTVGADPVNNMDVATKQYVDNSKEIFIATYGTTTYAEINTAYTAGKTVIVARDFNGTTIYTLTNVGTSGTFHFRTFSSSGNIVYGCYIGTDGVWHVNSNTLATQSALETGLATKQKTITVSTEEPTSTDGADGDIWFVYEE